MNTETYNQIIQELQELDRPDFEIEEVGYFLNEIIILKKEKMPLENINEEIDKFQRIVIDNDITKDDEEELYEDMNRKQMKKDELLTFLKKESFFSPEELDMTEDNIVRYLNETKRETVSEYDLYKFNEKEYQDSLQAEKEATNYKSFDYAAYLKEKLEKYD